MKIKRVCAGLYKAIKNGREFEVFQYDEGNWKGWWLVTTNYGHNYSDPVRTYKEAKEVVENWTESY